MAVVFDTQKNLNKVERYDEGTEDTIILTINNFDIFDTGAEIGDAMVFNYGTAKSGMPWHDLYLSISTPLSMVATLTWYYRDGNNWYALTITNDGTNGFTQSGWIEFDCPPIMRQGTTYPGRLAFAIKCEITAFTSITTVGHSNATPQIKDYAITVTGSETMTSIKTANDSGTWGVVDQEGSRYKIWCNLDLQGLLESVSELIELGDDDVQRFFICSSAGELRLGTIDGEGKTSAGSIFKYTNTPGSYPFVFWKGILTAYASEFYHNGASERDFYPWGSSAKFYFKDSVLRAESGRYLQYDQDFIDSHIIVWPGSQRIFVGTTDVIFDNVRFIMDAVWAARDFSFTIENCDLSEDYLHIVPYALNDPNNSICTMIDCDLGDDFGAKIAPHDYGIGIVKYNLNLTIHDKDGNDITDANLIVEDSYENEIYNGIYSGGNILLEVFKEVRNNTQTDTYDYNPFTITITKDGYQDYQDVVEIKKRTEQCIALQLPGGVPFPETVIYNAELYGTTIY